jgi:hypothetical protein
VVKKKQPSRVIKKKKKKQPRVPDADARWGEFGLKQGMRKGI